MKSVLITDKVHEILPKGLISKGFEVKYIPEADQTKVLDIISQYDGIVINSKIRANRELMKRASRLKFIGRLGSGLDIIDLNYAAKMKIKIINTPEGNRNAVAEHTLGMILSVFNHLMKANRQVKTFTWSREENRGIELAGKTLGIIGFGNTGGRVAQLLQNWDMRILVYDKYKSNISIRCPYVEQTDLKKLMKHADILSFHVPLNEETRYYGDKEFFNNCKKGCTIVNTSRGKVVSIEDLLLALKSGQINGACLDVLENEKPETYTKRERELYGELFSMENVILSPHIAGWSKESLFKIAKYMLDKICNINFQ